MKNHYSNPIVEHSAKCFSSRCLASGAVKHTVVYHFDTKTDCYQADSLDDAARMWIADGAKELVNVGRNG